MTDSGSKMKLARGLGITLSVWSISSFIAGIFLYLSPSAFMQGIGLQAILWGIIDGAIALFTLFRQSDQPVDKLAKILLINVGLDVVYQVVGLILLIFAGADVFISGNGFGIIIQGAFLFILDLYYYLKFKNLSQDTRKI